MRVKYDHGFDPNFDERQMCVKYVIALPIHLILSPLQRLPVRILFNNSGFGRARGERWEEGKGGSLGLSSFFPLPDIPRTLPFTPLPRPTATFGDKAARTRPLRRGEHLILDKEEGKCDLNFDSFFNPRQRRNQISCGFVMHLIPVKHVSSDAC